MNFHKIVFITFAMSILGIDMRADSINRSQNIYLSLFSSSDIVSVNYDTRFSGNSVYGWHVGIGYSTSCFNGYNSSFGNYRTGVSLPLGVNALFGKNASKFEIGVGVTPGIYSYRNAKETMGENEHGFHKGYEDFGSKSWRGGCGVGIDLGYRLQKESGFCFRIGISPYLDVNSDLVSMNIMSILPYFSFGYTFK